MDTAMVGALAALGGAVLGGSASILTMLVQSHYQGRRELRRMAVDAAIEDYRQAVEVTKLQGEGRIPPLSGYVWYHASYLDLLFSRNINEKTLAALQVRWRELFRPDKK